MHLTHLLYYSSTLVLLATHSALLLTIFGISFGLVRNKCLPVSLQQILHMDSALAPIPEAFLVRRRRDGHHDQLSSVAPDLGSSGGGHQQASTPRPAVDTLTDKFGPQTSESGKHEQPAKAPGALPGVRWLNWGQGDGGNAARSQPPAADVAEVPSQSNPAWQKDDARLGPIPRRTVTNRSVGPFGNGSGAGNSMPFGRSSGLFGDEGNRAIRHEDGQGPAVATLQNLAGTSVDALSPPQRRPWADAAGPGVLGKADRALETGHAPAQDRAPRGWNTARRNGGTETSPCEQTFLGPPDDAHSGAMSQHQALREDAGGRAVYSSRVLGSEPIAPSAAARGVSSKDSVSGGDGTEDAEDEENPFA